MKNKNIHISPSVLKDDFKAFFEGNMDEQQKKSFISKVENDEYLYEAYKGYLSFPDSINDINEIDKNIKTKYTKNSYSSHIKIFSSIIGLIVIILISIYFFKQTNKPKYLNRTTSNTAIIDTQKLNIINKEIEQANLIPISKQITSLKTKIEQKKVTFFEKAMPIETIDILHAISVNLSSENENSNLIMAEHYKYMSVDYMFELKVIDYTKTNRTKIKKDITDGGSLAPKYENRFNLTDTLNDNKPSIVTYVVFLNDAMGKFSSNNFKEALHDYNIILQHYPEDQNAHFYGGLCYYNIGLYENAITFFNEILESNVATFTQEALWYKALSLYNQGNEKESEIILNKIIEAKGFYANRARELKQENK